jgi:hypothetical protein
MRTKFKDEESLFKAAYKNRIPWKGRKVYMNNSFSEEFLDTFKDKIYWQHCFRYQKMTEDMIRKYVSCGDERDNWIAIVLCQKLSEDFIKEVEPKLNTAYLSVGQKLSIPYIRSRIDELDWAFLSQSQAFSSDNILEFWDHINWEQLSYNHSIKWISDEIIIKLRQTGVIEKQFHILGPSERERKVKECFYKLIKKSDIGAFS